MAYRPGTCAGQNASVDGVLLELERYFDAVPREHARVEEVGPFTLFAGDPEGWTFCARPRLSGAPSGVSPTPYDASSVRDVLRRMSDLGLPPVIEWVHEVTPDLLAAVLADGTLEVEEIPLMVLAPGQATASPAADVTVRVVGPSDLDALAQARAVAALAFAAPGTEVGDAGVAERDAAVEPVPDPLLDVLRRGEVAWVVAEHRDHGVVACGRHLPLHGVTEVVGVATLPAFRRRGLAADVTRALVGHASAGGNRTVFLTASSADVARLYAGLGFERVATAYAAERS